MYIERNLTNQTQSIYIYIYIYKDVAWLSTLLILPDSETDRRGDDATTRSAAEYQAASTSRRALWSATPSGQDAEA